jgi:hypothetical protein
LVEISDAWDELSLRVERLFTVIRKVNAVAVNSKSLKSETKDAVQHYFRVARPRVVNLGSKEEELQSLDTAFQDLNALAQGNNRKKSYLDSLKISRTAISNIGMRRHQLAGARTLRKPAGNTTQQQKIIATLRSMVPNNREFL